MQIAPGQMIFSPFEVHRSVLPHELNRRGLTGAGVEIGVAQGYFSEHILKYWRGFLYLVDPYENTDDYAETYPQEENLKAMEERLEPYRDRTYHYRMPSLEAAKVVKDDSLSFVYIDGNHSYEHVRADLRAWWPKLKEGGIFAGDDYGCFDEVPVDFGPGKRTMFGVKHAVDEWALDARRNISINWLADWCCRGHILKEDGSKEEWEVRARNWWLVK